MYSYYNMDPELAAEYWCNRSDDNEWDEEEEETQRETRIENVTRLFFQIEDVADDNTWAKANDLWEDYNGDEDTYENVMSELEELLEQAKNNQ